MRHARRLAAGGIHAHSGTCARRGLADRLLVIASDPTAIRVVLGVGFEDSRTITDAQALAYFAPFTSRAGALAIERMVATLDCAVTLAIESDLRRFDRPTLIVWGSGDQFFDMRWSRWLADTIPGTVRRVELDGAKLFFPAERPDAFNAELRRFWNELGQSTPAQAPAGNACTPCA